MARALALCALGATLPACGGAPDDGAIETRSSAALALNALSLNALSLNALSLNALSLNALTLNALTLNALSLNALTLNGLRDPLAREFLTYVVSCALDDDQSLSVRIDGKTYVFQGDLGLAPEWGERGGTCGDECQRWVSACMLARVDHAGVHREISLRGVNKALKTEPREVQDYPVREAAYFGNVLIPQQQRYLCLPRGQTSDERVCGPSLADCGMTVVGACEDACAKEGQHHSFLDCSSSGQAHHPDVFSESITVFLPK